MEPHIGDHPSNTKARIVFDYKASTRRRHVRDKDGFRLEFQQELSAGNHRKLYAKASELVWKGMPVIDIAVEVPVSGKIPSDHLGPNNVFGEERVGCEVDFYTRDLHSQLSVMDDVVMRALDATLGCADRKSCLDFVVGNGIGPLLQFKDYRGLNLRFYDQHGGLFRTDTSDEVMDKLNNMLWPSPTTSPLKDFYSQAGETSGKKKPYWGGTRDSNYRNPSGRYKKAKDHSNEGAQGSTNSSGTNSPKKPCSPAETPGAVKAGGTSGSLESPQRHFSQMPKMERLISSFAMDEGRFREMISFSPGLTLDEYHELSEKMSSGYLEYPESPSERKLKPKKKLKKETAEVAVSFSVRVVRKRFED